MRSLPTPSPYAYGNLPAPAAGRSAYTPQERLALGLADTQLTSLQPPGPGKRRKLPGTFSSDLVVNPAPGPAEPAHCAGSRAGPTKPKRGKAEEAVALACRKDAPLVLKPSVGSRDQALKAADSEETRTDALSTYEKRVYAASVGSSGDALWATWCLLHRRWFGDHEGAQPVLPLTAIGIKSVVAMLIQGGYRSVPNYLSRAKDEHCAEHNWEAWLAREHKRATAAATRGLGPAHQCSELPLVDVWSANLPDSLSRIDGAPQNFKLYYAIGCFFVMREAEVSQVLASSVAFNLEKLEVTLLLPAGKTDPGAVSCSRTWGCVCGQDPSLPCAYHAARTQWEWLSSEYGGSAHWDPQLPFFPAVGGGAAAKAGVVEAVELVAQSLGIALLAVDGRAAFGGHVCRISGSRYLAYNGLEVRIIMILARWDTNVILHYLKEAPLKCLTDTFLGRRVGAAAASSLAHKPKQQFDKKVLQQAADRADAAEKEIQQLKIRIAGLESGLEDLGKEVHPPLIIAARSSVFHYVGGMSCNQPPEYWVSRCGWYYAKAKFTRAKCIPAGTPKERICDHCADWNGGVALMREARDAAPY